VELLKFLRDTNDTNVRSSVDLRTQSSRALTSRRCRATAVQAQIHVVTCIDAQDKPQVGTDIQASNAVAPASIQRYFRGLVNGR
jgi:hypothetical protein